MAGKENRRTLAEVAAAKGIFPEKKPLDSALPTQSQADNADDAAGWRDWPAGGESLAQQINGAHAAAQHSLRASVEHAIRAGELLIEAKRTIKSATGHGSWTTWLAENVEFSERLAQSYMRLARLPLEKRNAV